MSDINIKTLQYVKKYKKQKPSRNLALTRKYLKDNDLQAVPFDKGIGICLMKRQTYEAKLSEILSLPQFVKEKQTRKNAKHPVIKEHERICSSLLDLNKKGKIDDELYEKLKPTGSQPARLYGIAKVHKNTVPTRPFLSMPGSAYHKIGLKCTEWLSVVKECQVNSSTKSISESLKSITLEEDEVIVSFDVTSLYTNVPVNEAIMECADMLYSGKYELPPVEKETFIELLRLSTCDVLMSTHDGYYRQVDGLAMGSPPAPLIANGWLYKRDVEVRGDAKLYARYMDDIIRSIKRTEINNVLESINKLHPQLKFTIERENEGKLPFLDMLITRRDGKLISSWYSKPTDTGLIMNFHSLAPKRYKRSVVSGFVHRIHRACSTWEHFHTGLVRATQILEQNQYPPQFYEPIIEQTITKLVENQQNEDRIAAETNDDETKVVPKKMIFIQYRGKVTEDYSRALMNCNAPVTPIFTMRKLKTVLPSLKTRVDHKVRNAVVYKITCPRCASRYVGYTIQHINDRFRQHLKASQPVGKHLSRCEVLDQVTVEDMEILESCTRSVQFLQTLEAIHQELIRPEINKKEEWRSRELTIKL